MGRTAFPLLRLFVVRSDRLISLRGRESVGPGRVGGVVLRRGHSAGQKHVRDPNRGARARHLPSNRANQGHESLLYIPADSGRFRRIAGKSFSVVDRGVGAVRGGLRIIPRSWCDEHATYSRNGVDWIFRSRVTRTRRSGRPLLSDLARAGEGLPLRSKTATGSRSHKKAVF